MNILQLKGNCKKLRKNDRRGWWSLHFLSSFLIRGMCVSLIYTRPWPNGLQARSRFKRRSVRTKFNTIYVDPQYRMKKLHSKFNCQTGLTIIWRNYIIPFYRKEQTWVHFSCWIGYGSSKAIEGKPPFL